ncbi:hypothetical protein FSP39_010196 [Pinctada imbricata]|uniref:tRNA-guanine(15) transglycosylase-like domain-containing protein n=1 Tax=Pinctada imbricata TaxID=66713 RepID=A0AA88XLR0_PINIB|nr:hypothetical protein FSP39_010196 [Pinctada imbricata]
MMKFVVQNVRNGGCRLGILSEISGVDQNIETPMCMLYTRAGIIIFFVDIDLFMKIQEAACPTIYTALSDSDTDAQSGKKRCTKAVDRTLGFLDDIVDRHRKSKILKDSALIGAVVGGYSEHERLRSAKETSTRPVQGIFLQFLSICWEVLSKIRRKINFECLPEDKCRLLPGVLRPDQVLHAVTMGIDIFDSSYPLHVRVSGKNFRLPSSKFFPSYCISGIICWYFLS